MKNQAKLLRVPKRWSAVLLFVLNVFAIGNAQITLADPHFTLNAAGRYIGYFSTGSGTPILDFSTTSMAGVNWTINVAICTAAPCPVTSINSSNGQTNALNLTNAGFVRFSVDDGQGLTRDVDITIRRAMDIALVLDKSGSMAWGFDGSSPPGAGQEVRWELLVNASGLLADKLDQFGTPEDQIGIRYFHSSAEPPAAMPFNAGLVNLKTNAAGVETEVDSQTPAGWTALGLGMISGRDMLLAPVNGHRKVMFVFSDGDQNWEGPEDLVFDDGNPATLSAGEFQQTVGPPVEDLNGPTNEIRIYTVCLGSTTGFNLPLMEGIAAQNGATFVATGPTDSEMELSALFDAQVNEILALSSPQFVKVSRGNYQVNEGKYQVRDTFEVNKDVDKVYLVLGAANRHEPYFESIIKDGVNLLQYATQKNGNGFITLTWNFPLRGLPAMKAEGSWQVLSGLGTRPQSAPEYYLSFTVNDHLNDFEYSIGGSGYKAGDVLKPSVKITRLGQPLSNATVQAVILKPGDNLGNLLALAGIRPDGSQNPDDDMPGSQVLAELMKDPAFVAKMKAKAQILTLNYQAGTQTYSGEFAGLDVAGIYQIYFKISANDPAYGRLERFAHRSFNVRFPDVDPGASEISSEALLGNSSKNTGYIITARFKDSQGNFIGPGWARAVRLDAKNATITKVTDLGDGTYKIEINGALEGKGRLSIGGATVIDGDLWQFNCYGPNATFWQKIQCWLLGLGLPRWSVWLLILLLLGLVWLLRKLFT